MPRRLHVLLLAALLALASCAAPRPQVLVPPRMDLGPYGVVGLVQLSANSQPGLDAFATEQLVQQLKAAQPAVQIVVLGTQAQLLASVGKAQLDADALRAIGSVHRVPVLIAGVLEVADARPSVDPVALLGGTLSVSAKVRAKVTPAVYDTAQGTTLWTSWASGEEDVAGMAIGTAGASLAFDRPENAYGRLVSRLVGLVTDDFRAHWVLQ